MISHYSDPLHCMFRASFPQSAVASVGGRGRGGQEWRRGPRSSKAAVRRRGGLRVEG